MNKWIILVGLLAMGAAGYLWWNGRRIEANLEQARSSLKEEDYTRARVYAQKVLSARPNHPEALLVNAEAVFKDPTLDPVDRVNDALESLNKIGDVGETGFEARKYEASLYLFNLLKPTVAEQSLVRATHIFEDRLDAYSSLLQIYCCTERGTLAEPIFLKAIEVANTRQEKYRVLSDWFLSQFSVNTYNSRTDQLLQTSSIYPDNIPTEQKRLLAFRDASPDDFRPKVALAYWFYIRNDPEQAKKLLDQVDVKATELHDPLYLITTVNVLLEVGEIELAQELHAYWNSEKYFEYWRQKGVIEQDYENDPQAAVDSYERALKIWPGVIDPSVYFRLESCWKIIGSEANAEKYRLLGEQVRNTTNVNRIKEMQGLLLNNDQNPETLLKFARFYEELGRGTERDQWEQLGTAVE